MTQLEMIVKVLKNLGGKGTYSQIYEEFEKGNFDSCEIKVNGKIIKDFKPYSIPDHKDLMPESIKTFCANVETKAQQKQIVEVTGIKDETKFKWMELIVQ